MSKLTPISKHLLCASLAGMANLHCTFPARADSLEPLIQRAIAIEKDGDHKKAIEILNDVIARGSKKPGVFYLRGDCYQASGKHKEAIADFTSSINVCANNPTKAAASYAARGRSYRTLGNLTQAISDFDQALKLNSSQTQVYISRGDIYMKLTEYQKAIDDYSSALRSRVVVENIGRVLLNRAQAYEKLGRPNMAKMDRLRVKQIEKDCALDSDISLHDR